MVEVSKVEQKSTFDIKVNGVAIKLDEEKLLAGKSTGDCKRPRSDARKARGLSAPRGATPLQARGLG